MISLTRSRIAASNPSRREPSWPTSIAMLVFAMAYSSCALNLLLRDSGLSPSLTSQENTPSTFLQEWGQNRPLHPIMDYKICFTLNNVSELHRCRRENFVSPFVQRFSATHSSRTFSISCSDKFQLALH